MRRHGLWRKYEFWILDARTKERIKKIRTNDKQVEYQDALYTIEGFEHLYLFRVGFWKFKRKVYLFIEGNSTPIMFETIEVDAHRLKTIIQTLAYNLAYIKLEAYLKMAMIFSIIAIIAIAGVGYFLYDFMSKKLVTMIVKAIAEQHAVPVK